MDCLSYTVGSGADGAGRTSEEERDGAHGSAGTIGSQHLALREQVLAELRRRIVDGDYPPGERLTEDRLAADFGVSRNPVREALRDRRGRGLGRRWCRAGARSWRPPTRRRSRTCSRCGRALETLAARLAAERATTADVADLRALLDAARAATEQDDFVARGRAQQRSCTCAVIDDQRQPLAAVDLRCAVPARALGVPDRRGPPGTALVGGAHPPGRRDRGRRRRRGRGGGRRARRTPRRRRPRPPRASRRRGVRAAGPRQVRLSGRRHSPASRAGSRRRASSPVRGVAGDRAQPAQAPRVRARARRGRARRARR